MYQVERNDFEERNDSKAFRYITGPDDANLMSAMRDSTSRVVTVTAIAAQLSSLEHMASREILLGRRLPLLPFPLLM